jgi:hypothetical protein
MPETSVIVGASLAVHFFVEPGRSSLGPPSSCPYSPECVEGLFHEVGRHPMLLAEATPLSEYQLILRLPQAELMPHQHQGLLYG